MCYHGSMGQSDLDILEIKNARDSEEAIAVMEQIFAAIGTEKQQGFLERIFGPKKKDRWQSFEIVVEKSAIRFLIALPQEETAFLESQLVAQYPKLLLAHTEDYYPRLVAGPHAIAQFSLMNAFYYPMKTYKDVRDIDLLASVVGRMATMKTGESAAISFRVSPAGTGWQRTASRVVSNGIPDPNMAGRVKTHPHARLIESKTNQIGFSVVGRIIVSAASVEDAERVLATLAGSYGVFTLGEGNGITTTKPLPWQKKNIEQSLLLRSSKGAPKQQIYGASELASLWHPPGMLLSGVRNIVWGERLAGEAPENLPVVAETEEAKKEINYFARTEFRNKKTIFGIKREDRRKHIYIVGKTGTGKSTTIANMAINDMKNGEGLAVIDPHGDLIDVLLDYIPSQRINDVVLLDPSDSEYPFHINPLEIKQSAHRELVASGIVSIFYKLYHYSWGPRLEYILRNSILTLLYVPDSTLLSIPELLTNDKFREKVVANLEDHVLKNFWLNEFNKMTPQMRSESIMPILNKVGQFLSSQTIRNIVGSSKSTIDLEDMMNEGKIILVNLSQGKLGEDNSALLGAMLITKIQLAAMNRVYHAEENRKDFYLYVDEFQNFATNSFIKILSEARKYRLNLTLANQYIGQIDEDVQKAIFGNAGSIVSFCVGAGDARPLSSEFGMKYKEEQLVQLGNYQIVLKLSIDNHTSPPFAATTLPLPESFNQSREKIIRSSRERYTKKITSR